MDLGLTGKRAFISGSTQGIGYAVARALAKEGAAVTLNGRHDTGVTQAAQRLALEVPGARVDGIAADFADSAQVSLLLDSLDDVDVLVNNVGLFELREFGDITDELWQRYHDVNVMSGVRLSRRLLPAMLARGWGRIVFIGSESGVNVPADMLHYGLTKAAVLALGNGLAKLTRGTEVTVNTILGGPTWSDGVAHAVEAVARARDLPVADLKAGLIGQHGTSLVERFLDPDEIAHLAAYLASPLSSATNGAAVRADGGVLTATT